MTKIDKIDGYSFYFRSGGVVVLKGHDYKGFYDTFEDALATIFGDTKTNIK